jgi:hypothetical protein
VAGVEGSNGGRLFSCIDVHVHFFGWYDNGLLRLHALVSDLLLSQMKIGHSARLFECHLSQFGIKSSS